MKQTKNNIGNIEENNGYLRRAAERAANEEVVDASKPINRGPVDFETSEKRVVVR